jgi:hypothetical protein
MAKKAPYLIETLSYSSTSIVWLGTTKAAILFPPLHEGEFYLLYPHPNTYRELNFSGLPAPLSPGFMAFAALDDVRAFLGIQSRTKRQTDLVMAA